MPQQGGARADGNRPMATGAATPPEASPLIELPGCALGMEHRRTPLVEPASVQALGPLCELLTEQAGADGQRLFPVIAIAR